MRERQCPECHHYYAWTGVRQVKICDCDCHYESFEEAQK